MGLETNLGPINTLKFCFLKPQALQNTRIVYKFFLKTQRVIWFCN